MARPIRGSKDEDLLQDKGTTTALVGGQGDDTYVVKDTDTEIIERKNGGLDTVESWINFILPDWLENLFLKGSENLTGTGNELNNVLVGNSGDNALYGLAGDDTLEGGAGNDLLDGGDGVDTARYSGNLVDYSVETSGEDIIVSWLTDSETSWVDHLKSIELLSFADGDYLASDILAGSEAAAPPAPEPDPLFTSPDNYETLEDTSLSLRPLDNDQGNGLTITAVGAVALGTVVLEEDGSLTYTPHPDVFGTESLSYTVMDAAGNTATETILIDILAVNDAPEAISDQFEVSGSEPFESTISLLANDVDRDGEPLSVSDYDATTANGGTVTIDANGNFSYLAPSAYADGTAVPESDSFSYTVSDASGATSSATVVLDFLNQTTQPDTSGTTTTSTAPDYALEALLPGGLGDTALRWNAADPLGTPVTITYSFLDSVPDYYSSTSLERNNFQPLSEEQRAAVIQALGDIESFTGITFIEDQEGVGEITFGTADYAGTGWAYAPTSSDRGGDVWLNNSVSSNNDLSSGGDGYNTLIHEIGHALGLEHPHEGSLLPDDELNRQFTVMSYGEHPLSGGIEPSTYMLYDIAALQHLYGTNETATAGDDVYNLSNLNDTVMTIWDAGGWDILDASTSTTDVVLDLRSGEFSTSGTAYGWYPLSENIGIAYGTVIEEAIGGEGNDVLIGNMANNQLTGGTGSDTFVVENDWGQDSITDFEDGVDRLDMSSLQIGIEDLFITTEEGAAVISYGGNKLTLMGRDAEELDESDFLFGVA